MPDNEKINLSKARMSELLVKIREVADWSLRNGAHDAASGLAYICVVEDLLEEYGIHERNAFHEDCDGEGCVHCNFGRIRQEGDPVNPQGSKPYGIAMKQLRQLIEAELKAG